MFEFIKKLFRKPLKRVKTDTEILVDISAIPTEIFSDDSYKVRNVDNNLLKTIVVK